MADIHGTSSLGIRVHFSQNLHFRWISVGPVVNVHGLILIRIAMLLCTCDRRRRLGGDIVRF